MRIQLSKDLKTISDYGNHLKNLTKDDRFTRFGYQISDPNIDALILDIVYNNTDHYLFTAIDFTAEQVVGYGHLVKAAGGWELAVSVDREHQNRGAGGRLIKHMIEWGKLHQIDSVYMQCITDNQRIKHLAEKYGLRVVERDGTEITALVELPEANVFEHTVNNWREQQEIISEIVRLQRRLILNSNPLTRIVNDAD